MHFNNQLRYIISMFLADHGFHSCMKLRCSFGVNWNYNEITNNKRVLLIWRKELERLHWEQLDSEVFCVSLCFMLVSDAQSSSCHYGGLGRLEVCYPGDIGRFGLSTEDTLPILRTSSVVTPSGQASMVSCTRDVTVSQQSRWDWRSQRKS